MTKRLFAVCVEMRDERFLETNWRKASRRMKRKYIRFCCFSFFVFFLFFFSIQILLSHVRLRVCVIHTHSGVKEKSVRYIAAAGLSWKSTEWKNEKEKKKSFLYRRRFICRWDFRFLFFCVRASVNGRERKREMRCRGRVKLPQKYYYEYNESFNWWKMTKVTHTHRDSRIHKRMWRCQFRIPLKWREFR